MPFSTFLPYLAVMAVLTYLIRAIPFAAVHKKIQNRFLRSFLYYTPYAVLSAMTFPAILYATNDIRSAAAGLIAALVLAYFNKGLVLVATGACAAVFIAETVILYLI